MNNPVKPIQNFVGPPTPAGGYVLIAVLGALVASLVAGIILMVGDLFGFMRSDGAISFAVVTVIMVSGAALVLLRGYCLQDRERRYRAYLSGLPPAALVAAQKSPELNEESRKVIVGYLNEHHPDWSFEEGREDLSQSGAT